MSNKITIGKNGVDFKQAAGMVREYQKTLNDKCLQLCKELCAAGVTVARAKIGDSGFGRHITLSSEITPEQAGCKAVLYMEDSSKIKSQWRTKDGIRSAEISPSLMIEFGSGLKSENPAGIQGVGTGTFPGQTHAENPYGWWYMDLNNIWHHSTGVSPKMPMYFAGRELREKVVAIAREIFNS